MPPKRLTIRNNQVELLIKPKASKAPKVFQSNGFIESYIAQRNQVLFDMGKITREQLAEYGMIGAKSKPTAKIVHESQDAINRASRHEEDNIVNAWAKWFKATYPNIPYTIDKVAQRRSKLGGVIHKAAQYQKGNPDIFVQCQRGAFGGLYIEQKRSDDIFYQNTKILKPGSDNQHIWQSLYHAGLREQGYWVMFSISLEASKKITERYMAGNPYQMQEFAYYCKPEDYCIFEGNKHFKPVER